MIWLLPLVCFLILVSSLLLTTIPSCLQQRFLHHSAPQAPCPFPDQDPWILAHVLQPLLSGKSKGGLSKRGLGPKGANWAKKGPFGAISALPPWRWGAEESVPIGPEKAPMGPEKDPISPEKARFPRKDFPPIFSENLGLEPPFVSPPLDFPNSSSSSQFQDLERAHANGVVLSKRRTSAF